MQLRLPRHDRGHYKPNIRRRGLVASGQECFYVRRQKDGQRVGCTHRAYWYQVNHWRLSACQCHARQMSKRKGVRVKGLTAVPEERNEGQCLSNNPSTSLMRMEC